MKYIIITLLLFKVMVCRSQVKGFWIPDSINWEKRSLGMKEISTRSYSSFSILVFDNDSLFSFVTSTQTKYDDDSIFFKSEPGIILNKGSWVYKNGKNINVTYRLKYSTFPKVGQKFPGEEVNEVINIVVDSLTTVFIFQGIRYKKTDLLYKRSRDELYRLIKY